MNYKLYKSEWQYISNKEYHSREFIVKNGLIYYEKSVVGENVYFEGMLPEPIIFANRIMQYGAITCFVRDLTEEEVFLKFI